MEKKFVLGFLLVLNITTLTVSCPEPLVPGIDYPDWNADGVDDSTQTFTPKNRDELYEILDYQKEHEDKGWMVKSIDVSKIDLSSPLLFYDRSKEYADSFNQNVSNWDISKVTDMVGMFADTQTFNQSLTIWATQIGNVSDMSYMFAGSNPSYGAGENAFNQNLSSWDVTGKTTTGMFDWTPMENKAEWHPQGCRCGSTGCQDYRGYTVDEEGNIIE